MRALGTLSLALVLAIIPLTSACYRPRVESCRGPLGDFSGISNVSISRAEEPFAFETPSASVEVVVEATATGLSGDVCVDVHAELRDAAGGLVDQVDTPVRASVRAGLLQTTPIYFYHASFAGSMTVHVTLLGTTVDAVVTGPASLDSGFFARDAFVVRDAGPPPRDASVRDASADAATDGGDASTSDASTSDASTSDASTSDASTSDAGIDVGP